VFNQLRQFAWNVWEVLFASYWRTQDISPSGDELFRVNKVRYHGKRFELADGTVVNPGDPLVELHLSRPAVQRINAEARTRLAQGMAALRAGTRGLSVLAEFVEREPTYRDVVALRGTSMFYDFAPRLGFETQEIGRGWWWRLMNWHLARLMVRDHRERQARRGAQYRRLRTPGVVWMSRQALLQRYGPAESEQQVVQRHADEAPHGEAVQQQRQSG
jgi:hypothetical protein